MPDLPALSPMRKFVAFEQPCRHGASVSPLSNSVASEQPDPDTPLRLVKIGGLTLAIRQRVTGALYVRWPDGVEDVWPAGFSLDAAEQELRKQFTTPNDGGAR